MFLGNTLYAVALIYYLYITFLGYNCTSHVISANPPSIAVSEWDAITADPDSGDPGVIRY